VRKRYHSGRYHSGGKESADGDDGGP
jgi:hypothetical protein